MKHHNRNIRAAVACLAVLILDSMAVSLARGDDTSFIGGRWIKESGEYEGLKTIDVIEKDGQFLLREVLPDNSCGPVYAGLQKMAQEPPQPSLQIYLGDVGMKNGPRPRMLARVTQTSLSILIESAVSLTMRSTPPVRYTSYRRNGPANCQVTPVS